ncbi:hypothetical protein [Ectopseudomonas guguanensis]|uniref:hypothetical protein n=1 Tax=Ectopseudomonas guguanensis TaxID=1198456 RepID=UPI0028B1D153|nr:hypothetical protein [Pseudomonas guguanensis]
MAELLLRSLALLAEIVLEIIIGYVFYTTGWLALRLLTLDRYPICRCAWPTRWVRAAPGSPRSVSSAWLACH